ncbi:hypothetical protein LX64_05125 [Chitinophaga skermanii]|uniref:Uncharacterized protein n=1 Tax=Chitinophaga skermanii TaxID=331697 RepID=A0A327Q0N5_9BACT|nr:hypothetical protein [Chitinophaga skermanii]RAI97454.1 hypothetical protein LX64_05125 [Chitinophaga skermanii]
MTIQEYLHQLTADCEKLGLKRVLVENAYADGTFKVCFINKYEISRTKELLQDIKSNKRHDRESTKL